MTHPLFLKDDITVFDFLKPDAQKKKNTPFGTIYVNTDAGNIHFVQRWKYKFLLDEISHPHHQKASPWTDDEEYNFHQAAVALIWKYWNSAPMVNAGPSPELIDISNLMNANTPHLKVSVIGHSAFGKKFAGKDLFIDFDVIACISHPHYHVNVRKMLPGRKFRSNVTGQTINLKVTDVDRRAATQTGQHPAVSNDFYTAPHEFGHAVGYDTDEYTPHAAKRSDVTSIMNIGKEIRPRHFHFIMVQLNAMFPHTAFKIA
jgi:hypothetical protein